MATITSFELNIGENIKNANLVKEVILKQLLEDNVIKQDVYDYYTDDYNVIIVKSSWFKKWMKKYELNSEGFYYQYVKFSK